MTWDEVRTPEDELNIAQRNAIIQKLLTKLAPREQVVLTARFWLNETRLEIASRAGMPSTERIRQIEEKALRKLRHTKYAAKIRPYW